MTYAINAQHVSKVYRNGKTALSDTTIQIEHGSILGLLGPNGAGKSTFINILAGSVIKTSGSIIVNGFDIDTDVREVRRSLGIVPQEIAIDPFFSPIEALRLQAGLYGVRDAEDTIKELLEQLKLTDKAHAYSRSLSGGMRRRLLIAKAMVHRPPILVLDEPTAGVDISLREYLWEHIVKLNKELGTTIILTTHYLEEAEKLCDNITIINEGHCIASERKSSLMKRLDEGSIYIEPVTEITKDDERLTILDMEILSDGRLVKTFSRNQYTPFEILTQIHKQGIQMRNIEVSQPRLSEVFKRLTDVAEKN